MPLDHSILVDAWFDLFWFEIKLPELNLNLIIAN